MALKNSKHCAGRNAVKPLSDVVDMNYVPESFCADFVALKQNSRQLVQFMATALGHKRAYDDWFPARHIDGIRRLCREYGLHYKFDWIFVPEADVSRVISGGKRLPTTKMRGFPFAEKYLSLDGASVHVFFSASKRDLELCFRNGWYHLILGNRAVHKPYIDLLRFGYFLGYPDCCVDFFRRFNNHFLFNYLFEARKNTRGAGHIFCNPLMKDHTFSYIYHMPCSYSCEHTAGYAAALRQRLLRIEPRLVMIADTMLAKPFLVMGEQHSYVFEGSVGDDEIRYTDVAYVGVNIPEKDRIDAALSKGNRVRLNRSSIGIYRNAERIAVAMRPMGAFVLQCQN